MLRPMKHQSFLPLLLVVVGITAYAFLYYATPVLELAGRDGPPLRRAFFLLYLLRPDDLLRDWMGDGQTASLVDRLRVLLLAGGIGVYAASLGWLAMEWTGAGQRLTRLERFVFSAGVGLNLVSTLVLLAGLLGGLNCLLAFTLPAAATLAGIAWIFWRGRRAPAAEGRPVRSESAAGSASRHGRRSGRPHGDLFPGTSSAGGADPLLSKRWLWLAVPFAAVILLGGMLPPIEFDVREYHLQVPKEFFQQGYIGFLPHNVYGNMAMGAEMLSLLAMILAGDWWWGALVGKTLIAAFAPLTALALFAAGHRFVSTAAGVVAAVAFLSVPWIVQVSTLGLVEGAAAFYLFLAFYAILLYFRARQPISAMSESRGDSSRDAALASPGEMPRSAWPRLLLAGYLAGAAVSTKYPAVLFVAVPLTAFLAWMHIRRDGKTAWKPVGVFLLAAAAGCGLWFGKNWVLTGNPTYPLLYEIFGGETRTPEKNEQWTRAHRPKDFSPTALVRDLARVGLTSPWISPILLPLAVLAFLGRGRTDQETPKIDSRSAPRAVPATVPDSPILASLPWILAAYFAYILAAWWLFTHRIDRFWIPAMPLLALLAGMGAQWQESRPWRGVLVAILLFGSAANFVVAASPLIGDNRFFVPLNRLRVDPLRVDAWHRYFNAEVPDGRVLTVGDAQVFDMEPPVIYDTCFDSSRFEQLVKDRSPQGIRSALEANGITHVFVHWGEIARYRATYGYTDYVQPEVFQRLVDRGILEPLPSIDGHPGRGYRVRGG